MKKNKLPNFVSILVLTLITVVMWITLNLYRALATNTPPSVPDEISKQLIPSLDKDTISEVDKRILLLDDQIPDAKFTGIVATPAATATPVPIATTVASPSAIPVTNQSTSSGTGQ